MYLLQIPLFSTAIKHDRSVQQVRIIFIYLFKYLTPFLCKYITHILALWCFLTSHFCFLFWKALFVESLLRYILMLIPYLINCYYCQSARPHKAFVPFVIVFVVVVISLFIVVVIVIVVVNANVVFVIRIILNLSNLLLLRLVENWTDIWKANCCSGCYPKKMKEHQFIRKKNTNTT